MILLQGFRFIQGAPGQGTSWIWVLGGLVAVVGLILVVALVARLRGPRSAEAAARYGRRVFRRTARNLGLTEPQIETLETLVRATKVRQPFLLFTSASLLDDVLRKGLYSVDAARGLSDEERESRKTIIFGIKQAIEASARRGVALKSTHFLKPGQSINVTPEGGEPFTSKVVSNMKDFLTIQAPLAAGSERWPRGTLLSLYFWRESDAGYSFASKILGYDTVKGSACLLIQHSKTLRKEQRRRHRRKPLMRACFAYPVRILGDGSDRRAAVETSLRTLGTVVDLSAGGCAIQTLSPFDPGRLVMIEFDFERTAPVRAFGKVRSVRRMRGKAGIMHVMFTRVTREYLNRICEFVYDFARPRTVAESGARVRPATTGEAPGWAAAEPRAPGARARPLRMPGRRLP